MKVLTLILALSLSAASAQVIPANGMLQALNCGSNTCFAPIANSYNYTFGGSKFTADNKPVSYAYHYADTTLGNNTIVFNTLLDKENTGIAYQTNKAQNSLQLLTQLQTLGFTKAPLDGKGWQFYRSTAYPNVVVSTFTQSTPTLLYIVNFTPVK